MSGSLRTLALVVGVGGIVGLLSDDSFSGMPVRPDVLLFIADDLGWNDIGYHNPEIQTPNIDKLAREGTVLERFYVNPTCSPTRASLMTGKFATTVGMDAPIQWHTEGGLPLDERTLADHMREAGYQTYLIGKWHLGKTLPEQFPTSRGFDHFYGLLNGAIGHYDHVYSGGLDWQRDGKTVEEEGHATDLISREASNIIRARDPDRPLFLTVSFTAPHIPLEPPPGATDLYADIPDENRRKLLGLITHMDSAIGSILETLEDERMTDDTLVVFMSDNGGQLYAGMLFEFMLPALRDGAANNDPLRSGKGFVFEGGIRVPAALRWPGHIKPGSIVEQPIFVADLLPTLGEVAGNPIDESTIDGQSQWYSITTGELRERRPFLVSNLGSQAWIDWPWKLVMEVSLPMVPEFLRSTTYSLYHLEADPEERYDLSEQHPKRFEALKVALAAAPRRAGVELDLDQENDTFGGEITRPPWAEVAHENERTKAAD